eukprot:2831363-Prymnesium_polylepis.1
MQTVALPLVLVGMIVPVLVRLYHLRVLDELYPEEWDYWLRPIPINGTIGLLVITINAVQANVWHTTGLPKRCGRLGALCTLGSVRGYHAMISYDLDGSDHAQSLASALSQSGLNVWLDTYRLENAYNLKQAVFTAARDAGFVVLVITPRYLLSPNRCLELLAALRRPREQ